jgi:hypothetical protein
LGKVIHGAVCIEDKAAGSEGLWKAGRSPSCQCGSLACLAAMTA